MPLPIETLLRVHDSPVPAQIVFGACGSMATAPIDCELSLSKTVLKFVPPFEVFQTAPLAAPMYTVSRPSSFNAAMEATRPLIAAEPIFQSYGLFDFLDGELRPRSARLLRLFDGKRIINAVHLFVVTVIHLGFLQRATNRGLNFHFQLQVRVRIQVVVTHVPVFHAQ